MDVWTARHEAGHAVVSLALLGDVGLVRVHARGGNAELPGYADASAEDRAALAMAGVVAEALAMGDRTAALTAGRALTEGRAAKTPDGELLAEILADVPQHGRQDLMRAAGVRAQQIIEGNAGLYLRMVGQLLDMGVMTGDQVRRWLDPPKPAAKPTRRATIPPMTWNDGPLPGGRGRRTLTAGELRSQADKAERAGNDYAARLMRQSAARMDGNKAAGLSRSVANMNGREVR